MNTSRTALVLEGGALRSLYTSGVLDVFMEQGLTFPYVIGTSAGALCGMNYITNQPGRTADININYCDDKHYISYRNLLFHGGVFNMDYLFEEHTRRWPDLDIAAYQRNPARFVIVATSCETGAPVYFENPTKEDLISCLKASSSMPPVSKKVETPKGLCLDGGVADSIPYAKAFSDGFESVVVVRTQDRTYRKKETSSSERRLYRLVYRGYDGFIQTAINRPIAYNEQAEKLYALEKAGRAFIIEPKQPVTVARMEKDKEKLRELYRQGKADARGAIQRLSDFLNKAQTPAI